MMFAVTRIPSSLIEDRLDARYNAPLAVETRKKILTSGIQTGTVGSLYNLVCGPFGSTLTSDEHNANGEILLIQPTNISGDSFSDTSSWRITKKALIEKDLKTYPQGTLLFARVGIYPHVGIIPKGVGLCTISSSMIAGLPKRHLDAHYFVAFFKCSLGNILLNAAQKVTAQPTIGTTEIANTLVPIPSGYTQKYIGDKVRQAEQLRAWAKRLNSVLQSQIHSVFKGDPKPEKRIGKVISIQQLSSLRLEAEYYGDLELWAELEIKNSPFPNQPLGELSSRIKDGPGGWAVSTNDYRPSGIPVIRSVNLIDGRCELDDCVFISKEKHNDLRSHQVKPGGLLLSVRGTIGRAAVFDSEKYSTASLNAAVVTIDCKPTINPYYLAAFLNSEVGRIQSNRIANGAVQLNMNLKETASNLIVIPPINLQEAIAATFLSKNRAVILANLLTNSAKNLVEALIEGQLTEQQLIKAQQALEDGDNSLDLAILSKLSAKGYAIEGATPLFSDVDELYSLLEDAAQAEAEE